MFERFTDRARMVMALANQEAHRLNHDAIGTEHLLLGLLREESGGGTDILKALGVDPGEVRRDLENSLTAGLAEVPLNTLPQTAQAKLTISLAHEESLALGHNYVGTEHLLLGLVREETGIAGRVLHARGVELTRARIAVGERRPPIVATGKPPLSQDALDVIGRGIHAARGFGHNPVEPEHLLIGLLLHGKGSAAELLKRSGLTIEDALARLVMKSEPRRGRRG